MTTNEEMIGRAEVNDLEAILAITSKDVDEMVHAVKDNADALFTWNYEKGARPALNKLYEKAKGAQWNGETDLDWSIDVDQEQLANMARQAMGNVAQADVAGTPFEKWGDQDWIDLDVQMQNWSLSQFMH